MQTISKLSDECQKCPHVNDCGNKRMVACAMREFEPNIAVEVKAPITMPIAHPMLKIEHSITINMGEYGTINTSLEKIAEKLKEDLYKNFNCSFNK